MNKITLDGKLIAAAEQLLDNLVIAAQMKKAGFSIATRRSKPTNSIHRVQINIIGEKHIVGSDYFSHTIVCSCFQA